MARVAIIVVAAGVGSRMAEGTSEQTPKQFMLLRGKPILLHTVERFAQTLPDAQIVVVLSAEEAGRWRAICEEYGLCAKHEVCEGGSSRFHSVKNALNMLSECDYIGVHDGVRPLVSSEVILTALNVAKQYQTAVPVVEAVDSFRVVSSSGGSAPIERSTLRAVQTPQFFERNTLTSAYNVDYTPSFTDDASVVERSGMAITLCQGERENIKITTPSDLLIAEALMK